MMIKQFFNVGFFAGMALFAASCSSDSNNPTLSTTSYIVGVGVTSNGATTNYAVKASDLMTGKITPIGNGLTLAGYRDFSQGNNTIFAVGGLGEVNVNGITQDASGQLLISGSATFDRSADDIQQVDNTQMLALEYPSKANGSNARWYFVDIASKAITKNLSTPLAPLVAGGDNPVYSGMVVRGSQLFVSNLHFDASYNTNHTDTNYVAVYTYPEIKFEKLITDTRTGPTGAWQTKNGLFKAESGDIYAMSSSNISNGYSKSTKPGGFLRIKSGETAFDQSYFFNTDKLGGKISHIKYVGNGLVFATISTITTQTADDRWGDKSLKMAIIDVVNQKITDVKPETGTAASLIHNGNGGRSFPVLVDGTKVYYPITGSDGSTFIYQIDVSTAVAKKGAEVQASFVGGLFKVQ
ncbi:DUF4374 domain-containing protein [Spirosoma sp. HMF4905]|uniref:DUF4374 domain-containing protein n=1 Tax=Spirosoma arboris TaxID=2682092 RepID=A0A7K1S9A7_9BACT|nr:DUF4374 domain-containing protein [Spirosoma arboris]MVM30350.1 DUF4374 domain-containing protein [Spirosoma arboris]